MKGKFREQSYLDKKQVSRTIKQVCHSLQGHQLLYQAVGKLASPMTQTGTEAATGGGCWKFIRAQMSPTVPSWPVLYQGCPRPSVFKVPGPLTEAEDLDGSLTRTAEASRRLHGLQAQEALFTVGTGLRGTTEPVSQDHSLTQHICRGPMYSTFLQLMAKMIFWRSHKKNSSP